MKPELGDIFGHARGRESMLKPGDAWKLVTEGPPHNQERRWLWWPISFGWGGHANWFIRHGVEQRSEIIDVRRHWRHGIKVVKTRRFVAQVWHFGRLKLRLGLTR